MLHTGKIHIPGGTEQEGARFHHATPNGTQFKTYELFIWGVFHLIFSDQGWLWATETGDMEGTLYRDLLLLPHPGSKEQSWGQSRVVCHPGFQASSPCPVSGVIPVRHRQHPERLCCNKGWNNYISHPHLHNLARCSMTLSTVPCLGGSDSYRRAGSPHCVLSSTAQGKNLPGTHELSEWMNERIFMLVPS